MPEQATSRRGGAVTAISSGGKRVAPQTAKKTAPAKAASGTAPSRQAAKPAPKKTGAAKANAVKAAAAKTTAKAASAAKSAAKTTASAAKNTGRATAGAAKAAAKTGSARTATAKATASRSAPASRSTQATRSQPARSQATRKPGAHAVPRTAKDPARTMLTRICLALVALAAVMAIGIAILGPKSGEDAGRRKQGEKAPTSLAASEETAEKVSGARLAKNVTISGVNVGGKSGPNALKLIAEAAGNAFAQTLTVNLPDATVTFAPEELNARLDAVDAVAQAQSWDGAGEALELTARLSWNEELVRSRLQESARPGTSQPTSADVVFSDNWLFITIGSGGNVLDVDEACRTIAGQLARCDLSPVTLSYHYQEPDRIDMSELYARYCTEPINAYYDETTGEIVRGHVGYEFDVEACQARMDAAQPGETVPVQLVETNPPVTYSFLASLGSMAELASYTKDGPAVPAEPVSYDDFPDELGAFSTEYSNNANRTNNLIQATAIINGTVLEPGDTFSFNGVVGQRTAEKGFKEAVAYVSGENVDEIGGGVCQVATTIYNAVLLADLEVSERYAHIYESHYVDQGLDATVSWPNPDFKFTNNSQHPILIEAGVAGGNVNVRLMGTRENENTVTMTSEVMGAVNHYQTVYRADSSLSLNEAAVYQGGSNGYTVRTFRNVYSPDGVLLSSNLEAYSTYQRRDRVVLVSPDSSYLW